MAPKDLCPVGLVAPMGSTGKVVVLTTPFLCATTSSVDEVTAKATGPENGCSTGP